MKRNLVIGIIGVALLVTLFLRLRSHPGPEHQMPGKFPEQLVYVRSSDDVVSAGVMFTTAKDSTKPIAIIWVHGWGANFYLPSYVGIGRELAGRGFTTLSVNTRMHDIGNVERYSLFGKRVRGGGYWGVTSQDAMDIAAWVDYVERIGFRKVVLVGHSAGWASVGRYQAEAGCRAGFGFRHDRRSTGERSRIGRASKEACCRRSRRGPDTVTEQVVPVLHQRRNLPRHGEHATRVQGLLWDWTHADSCHPASEVSDTGFLRNER
jgi:hypothetical protein